MKKVYQIFSSVQPNGLILTFAIIHVIDGEIKDFNVPEMYPELVYAAGKTEKEARDNLKKELDDEGIDYSNFGSWNQYDRLI